MLWMTIAVVALLVVLTIYSVLVKKRSGEPQDERSAKCSLLASRNGFIVAIALVTLLGVTVKLGAPISMDSLVQMTWGLSTATYFLSYIAYKRLGLA
ncbi:hypothetical protein NRC14 [Methanocella arvoryzae MRE50]|uniref:Uncharacterized protein n=1 Tax=Methanocella arvoryzae (strain DSM 22066 / NBRC 105507 / MRE50) TaxID=351160 RepID=Q0W7L9_METAR|nr:hypothetical protein NRC14 [Methanocella arvoryzae MRE50]